MRVWLWSLGVVVLLAGVGSAAEGVWPELTEGQKVQLATAVDGERPDEPGLYPLLLSMGGWSSEQAAAAGAAAEVGRVADFAGFLAAPEGRRGELVVLEARFAGRTREVKLLRGGPWGRSVTEWGLVADGPRDAAGRVALVYFSGAVARPRDRQRVRVVARFFKLWTDVDAAGVATTYPVFVAAPFWQPAGGAASPGAGWRLMVVLVLGLMVVLWGVRRWLRPAPRDARPGGMRSSAGGGPAGGVGGDAWEPPLPEDPAEALGVLTERAKEEG